MFLFRGPVRERLDGESSRGSTAKTRVLPEQQWHPRSAGERPIDATRGWDGEDGAVNGRGAGRIDGRAAAASSGRQPWDLPQSSLMLEKLRRPAVVLSSGGRQNVEAWAQERTARSDGNLCCRTQGPAGRITGAELHLAAHFFRREACRGSHGSRGYKPQLKLV